jgi:hypothetical protein
MLPDPEERLLGNVVGIGLRQEDTLGQPDGAFHMAAHQSSEGALVAAGDGCHQHLVTRLLHHPSFRHRWAAPSLVSIPLMIPSIAAPFELCIGDPLPLDTGSGEFSFN